MALLTADLETVRLNLARINEQIAAACDRSGRTRDDVTICVATKYVDADGLAVLREAGVKVAGENRLQDLIAKQDQLGDAFEWHFIGAIQSRKVGEIAGRVSVIHSLSTESARDKLARLENVPELLVQVNIAGEESKQGVSPEDLSDFIAGSPHPISGLMTMPPATTDPEAARPHFGRLAELADEHGLKQLSMGTSQDFLVAVEEGATLIRLGSVLFDRESQ